MAGQRIDIMDLRQLIQLKIKGWSNRKIAQHLAVSRNTDSERYTQFVHHYRRWDKKTHASGILVHRAGAELFVDYAGKKLGYTDPGTGEHVSVEVFVAILPCSQLTFVREPPRSSAPAPTTGPATAPSRTSSKINWTPSRQMRLPTTSRSTRTSGGHPTTHDP